MSFKFTFTRVRSAVGESDATAIASSYAPALCQRTENTNNS